MYIFEDLNSRYPLHVRNQLILPGGLIFVVGIFGIVSDQKPMVVFLALLGCLVSGLITRVLFVQIDYTGGVRRKHVLTSFVALIACSILLYWTYEGVVLMTAPQFKRIVPPFLLMNFCLMYIPFLIVHGLKRINNQQLS